MPITFSTDGFDRIAKKLTLLENPDPIPLLEHWRNIVWEDNRAGVLAGLDGDGVPMTPTKYRGSSSKRTGFRRDTKLGMPNHPPMNFGPYASGLNGNLNTSEYRKLNGPPLAPRGDKSRVIANLETEMGQETSSRWFVRARWSPIVSFKGFPFIMAHFLGSGHLPRRDLRGIRPVGQAKIKSALNKWITFLLKGGTFQ